MSLALRQRPLARVVQGIVQAGNGCWLDPSDLSTLFQDAAGTTPVTAVEQPVGLMLDKAQGMMLGPELVIGGDFSAGTAGFTSPYSATVSVIDGRLRVTATGTNPYAQKLFSSVVGKYYKVSLDIYTGTSSLASPMQLAIASTSAPIGNSDLFLASNTGLTYKRYELIVLATTTTIAIRVRSGNTPIGTYFELDNVSVKELYGYHATQSITASRPTLSARYNLLTKTEDFSAVSWNKEFSGTGSIPLITQNYATAPDGTMTATRIVYALNGGTTAADYSRVYQTVALSANTQTSLGVWVKSANGQIKDISISMTGADPKLVSVGVDWVFVSNNMIRSDANYLLRFELRGIYGVSDSADILIWHPDLRLGTTPGQYQRVNTATDYDTDPRYFPGYLRFDGVDDYFNLPYMGLYGGGSASIVCARDAVSQATDTYIISERSTTDIDPKYFPSRQLANAGNMDAYISDDAGAAVLDTVGSPFSGVANAVIRSIVDSGNNLKLFKNGVLAANDNYTRAGTLTLNKTTIGASVSTTTSNYAAMKLYGLIITKSALTDSQRVACERYLGRKSGVQL